MFLIEDETVDTAGLTYDDMLVFTYVSSGRFLMDENEIVDQASFGEPEIELVVAID